MELSEEVKRQLAALSDDFTHQLPFRIQELQKALLTLRETADIQGMKNFRLMVHKLAGSAATFGHENLSLEAKEFEAYLEGFIENANAPARSEWEKIERYLEQLKTDAGGVDDLEELQAPEEIAEPLTTEQDVRSQYNPKSIYLYGFSIDLVVELSKQLGFYGYTVKVLPGLEELEKALESGSSQLIFVHTRQFEVAEGFAKQLSRLKKGYTKELYVVFISEEDTFDLRLGSVRAGGDAFYVLPLDIGQLMDKIESLVNREKENPYHVLIVDDDQEQVAYYALLLQQAGMITSVASDPMKVLSVLVESKPDLILMDIYMPGCSGTELTRLLRQHDAFITIPIIFLTFESSKERQLSAIRQGGDDFLTKPIKAENLISVVSLRAQRNRNLRYFMERDSLTGLLNHSNLKEQLQREVMRCSRTSLPLSFAMIDADHFKKVNDTYGHLTGDRVLKSLSRILQDRLRRTDILGRYGGEEFGVILLNTDAEKAVGIMDEIRSNFSRVIHHAEHQEFSVTFSCGIASFPAVKNASKLNEASDEALYAAKESGRNRVLHYDKISKLA
ncbi:MAG: diguanylate cyclase [Spirochaetaceae bacterium]|nr:diguanylate cyclase [Spirochaetaceae bacterium]MCF7948694.1 diguanylate cyclase [Spirochaetia bacterium]MCF7951158.1 diguanylate cyclase [Spirochaetaceae bacterium]